ncbi:MAG TPA: serine/threonine-protein kinase [Chloroflexota bacterium]|nr:serine/threonine-protein kinase [Chloroflexota bacterium]
MNERKLGPYQIVEQVGQGGMAIVYKAYQPVMDRYVALKVPVAFLLADAQFRARFQGEARTIAQLEHPHILPVHDFGEDNRLPYLVMRYVDGGTLRDHASRGLLPPEEVFRLCAEVAEALAYGHSKGVVHRDVKPANVLLDHDGVALLADFGIATMVAPTVAQTDSVTLGTPYYMAPEQVSDQPVDPRTDIYALGVVLYELLTGRRPYDGETPLAVARKHLTDPLLPPRLVNPALPEVAERIIVKAMAKDPADRYQSATDLARELRRLQFTLNLSAEEAARPTSGRDPGPGFDPRGEATLAETVPYSASVSGGIEPSEALLPTQPLPVEEELEGDDTRR